MSLDLLALLHSEAKIVHNFGLSVCNRVNKIFIIQFCPWISSMSLDLLTLLHSGLIRYSLLHFVLGLH